MNDYFYQLQTSDNVSKKASTIYGKINQYKMNNSFQIIMKSVRDLSLWVHRNNENDGMDHQCKLAKVSVLNDKNEINKEIANDILHQLEIT